MHKYASIKKKIGRMKEILKGFYPIILNTLNIKTSKIVQKQNVSSFKMSLQF